MRQIVNRFIKKHSLLLNGEIVIVGVSGGPDSIALLHFLKEQEHSYNLTLVAAHVNHMLRKEEAELDYMFVQQFCAESGIAFEGANIDVLSYQRTHNVSTQVAARECRYRFFQEVMMKHAADKLALAHHGDDQVETILMRQVRGAYGAGLAGIPVRRRFSTGEIIRPFLCVCKDEINTYCETQNLASRLDQSNLSSKYLRNRIRNKVLPILKEENPSVHLRFQQQSELMLEDQILLEELAETEIRKAFIRTRDKELVLSITTFNHIAVPLQRRGFQLILDYLYKTNMPEITTIHIEEFLSFLKNSHPSGQIQFPKGLTIKKSYDECTFTFNRITQTTSYQFDFPIPGIVTVKKGNIIGEVLEALPNVNLNENAIVCDLEKLTLPLTIRTRKKGDRLSYKGLKGTKKLKSLFIDNKVEREKRDDWPILVDGNGEIVWVPGLKRSTIATISSETKKFLLVYYKEGN
ncbi:tRNA lysidine(34) synthetase TilS [Anaerobacillus alkalilacustris]|uniref:tRNA(Ile)-lysidine synthase n=1 Tax=Anaerobacillus alkalilacustris TaxID=393763 RepID=A0A1S2LYF3_9BACI|nr:tRNA lysidine(34) synthetase TilS [Anaerobacillus alkalilacustris]OIJ17532.1 tRNA lysidine(34) synthetase TilS [Anaerobacillus alkalilacustris]